MAEITINIPEPAMTSLQMKLGSEVTAKEILIDAVTLFNWAVEERAKGRVILSCGENDEDYTQVSMPRLDAIKPA